jgi:prophage antirepressor-like protein
MPKEIPPIDASFDDLAKATMDYLEPDDAVEKFAKVTQQEMANQERSPQDMLNAANEGDIRHVPFRSNKIRSTFTEGAWWFSVVDVIEAVAETDRARTYWTDLKRRLQNQGFTELHDKIVQFKMPSKDGKNRLTDCVDTETLFRMIQSIPSPKAEPFRRWLAKVGYERILEEQDPEIAIKRALATYKAKGYTDEWINARLQTIASRKELTAEWKRRGIQEGFQYGALTDAISEETFDLKTGEHREHKGLAKHHNLRDHMSSLELALTMLGETTTAELAKSQDAQGFKQNKDAATLGGKIAGGARRNIEDKIGRKVVTSDNHLPNSGQKKLT